MNKNARCVFAAKILGMFGISLLSLSFFSKYVPFNMDEFCHYHILSCHYYPMNMLNTFREAAKAYYLAPFPNFYLPLRSCGYAGIVHCILYYPLFIVWPSPHSARLLGLIMLALQAFFLNRIFKTDIFVSFIFLLFCMPYAFSHIVDTGPVAFQTTSVFFICYLLSRWMGSLKENKGFSWRYPFIIGIILFLGIWSKVVYFFMLPALTFLILYYLAAYRKILESLSRLKNLTRGLLILFVSAIIPAFLLLNSSDPSGRKYYKVITDSETTGMLNFKPLLSLCKYFANPLKAASRIFKFTHAPISIEGILLAFIIILFISWGIIFLRSKKMKISFIVVNLLCFFMTLFLISKSKSAWAMHHVVLSLPFVVLALFYLISKIYNRKFVVLLGMGFLIVNFILYYNLTRLEYRDSDHPSKIKLNEVLNKKFSHQYVLIIIDWGMYYIKALYGNKEQCVLYMEPLTSKEQIIKLREVLNTTKRKALFIGRIDSVSDLELIKMEFPSLVELQTDFDTGKWRILYEK